MYHLYYRENREVSQYKEEYEANLLRAYRHLDVCRFKNKGWPCPTCPNCCFCGKDYETMTEVMDERESGQSQIYENTIILI